ncbi:MAG: bifunctional adenosylcobinamide kinase/adenosylcobinamide-phosphate guanylyltransferase [Clostridia bacterium]|nr:bifunctional adenosylcobinamide kinase/adenosylcobinamide-phosphate guanylyltransferase [Clostridia bacterium]
MGKLIMVTGGARSGKSCFAEETVKKFGEDVVYIATSIPFDDEMRHRIQKHREQRPEYWETVEAYKDLDKVLDGKLEGKSAVMLDCITIMVTNIMFEKCTDWDSIKADEINSLEGQVRNEVDKLIGAAGTASIPFIVVTNEIGMGIVPEYASARAFRDIAGRMNQVLAKAADEVYFCVSGIPMKIK